MTLLRFLVFILYFLFGQVSFSQQKDLILFIGQSNMAGRAEIGLDTLLIDKVEILNEEGFFIPARNPLNQYSTIRKLKENLQGLSPAYSFCKALQEKNTDTLRIIVKARGGTAIEKFMKGSDWGYYEASLNRVRNALNKYPDSDLRAIVFHQGESNRSNPEDYIQNLFQIVADLRADLDSPDLPFIIGEVGQWNPDYTKIRAIMEMIPEIIPFSYLISSDGLSNKDIHHFDRESVLEFGKRYAHKYQEIYYKK